ncbi:dihydropteroate synthase [Acetobacter thailandicus]|uniref:dihydropteroate synthase n=1 Tax=Acetobacter thailandicus TaxID=1502842 RepID=UPI001FD54138|nr:dihydropteroate synthase [Acetobacter thailandicus]
MPPFFIVDEMMDFTRLAEPSGLIYGSVAREAVRAGHALPLAGGPAAFTLVDLIDGYTRSGFMPVSSVPAGWQPQLERISRAPVSDVVSLNKQVMGIVNLTPDSFSSDGHAGNAEHAVAASRQSVEQGARILDIGGESTRPGSAVITPREEWQRIGETVSALREHLPDTILSVDTRHSFVMEQALEAGANIINDISALDDPDALPLLAQHTCGVVLMHMRGTPQTMGAYTDYQEIGYDTVRELGERLKYAVEGGIKPGRIIIDPGFGFAKTTEQNMQLLARVALFTNLGCPILVGVSRKRMIGTVTGVTSAAQRDAGTHTASLAGLAAGGCIARVHDVAGMMQSLNTWQALQNF